MADETIILEINLVDKDSEERIYKIKQELAALKSEQKSLNQVKSKSVEEDKKLSKQQDLNIASQKALTEELRAYEREVKNEIQANIAAEGSLVQLGKSVANLTKQYDNLSREERQGAKGKELLEKLNATKKELVSAKEETGRFQDSVGKYPTIFDLASGSMGKFGAMIKTLGVDINMFSKGASAGFSGVGKSVSGLGKMFLTPPIILIAGIVGAIAFVVNGVTKAFKKNDDAGTSLSKMFASFKPIGEAIGWVFDKIALAVAAVADAISWVIGLFSDAAVEAQNLVVAQDNLQEAERQYTVSAAKNGAKIAELRAQAVEDSKYTVEQQKKFLEEAIALEKENLAAEKAIKEEKLRIAKAVAKEENDTSDEAKDNIAQLQADVYNSTANYNKGMKKLASELETFNKQIADKEKKRIEDEQKLKDEAFKKEKERQKTLKTILRELEDEARSIEKDAEKKAVEDEKIKTARKIEDLKERLKTDENLTAKSRAAINELIEISQVNSEKIIAEIKETFSEQEFQKRISTEEKRISLLLEVAKKGSEQETQLRLDQIELQRQASINEAETTGADVQAINDKFDKLRTDAIANRIKLEQSIISQGLANSYKERELLILGNEDKLAELELEKAKARGDELASIDEETKNALFENDEAYTAAVLDNRERIINAEKELQATQMRSVQNQLAAYASIGDSVSKLFTEIAGDNEQMQGFLKAIALANIVVSSAEGVAGAIAAGAKAGPFPYNLAAIASGVASVTSGIVSAKQLLSDANDVSAPKFARGGLITGTGTGTSDSITARVSNGESVMTALTTSMFQPILSSLNQITGGNAIGIGNQVQGEEMLARAFAKGVSMLPNPVVSVDEINRTNNRVNSIEIISKL